MGKKKVATRKFAVQLLMTAIELALPRALLWNLQENMREVGQLMGGVL